MDLLEPKIDALLALPPYGLSPEEKTGRLLEVLRVELELVCRRHAGMRNYIEQWPVNFHDADASG